MRARGLCFSITGQNREPLCWAQGRYSSLMPAPPTRFTCPDVIKHSLQGMRAYDGSQGHGESPTRPEEPDPGLPACWNLHDSLCPSLQGQAGSCPVAFVSPALIPPQEREPGLALYSAPLHQALPPSAPPNLARSPVISLPQHW